MTFPFFHLGRWHTFRHHAYVILRPASRTLTLSSVEGLLHPPLVNSTLSEYFAHEILEKQSTRPALICRNELPRSHGGPPSHNLGVRTHLAWDFEEFDGHIRACARGLLNLGVKKGDRVGVIMGNNSAYASLQWACASIGAILVTINPAYRLHEFVSFKSSSVLEAYYSNRDVKI
jgi:acyl-CoA synthetase (AMP-forming)/AMP-acid ligase II